MGEDGPLKEKRAFPREKLRALCEFDVEGEAHSGFLLNLSPRGLFLQTRLRLPPGTEIELRLRDLASEPITVNARVIRRSASHRATSPVETGGMGLEVVNAPEVFYQVLYGLGAD